MAFHAGFNWFFARLDDGSVRVSHVRQSDGVTDTEFQVDAFTWASVVASVSKLGETDATFKAALYIHDGDFPAVASEESAPAPVEPAPETPPVPEPASGTESAPEVTPEAAA